MVLFRVDDLIYSDTHTQTHTHTLEAMLNYRLTFVKYKTFSEFGFARGSGSISGKRLSANRKFP